MSLGNWKYCRNFVNSVMGVRTFAFVSDVMTRECSPWESIVADMEDPQVNVQATKDRCARCLLYKSLGAAYGRPIYTLGDHQGNACCRLIGLKIGLYHLERAL
jgi:hypothetical protein